MPVTFNKSILCSLILTIVIGASSARTASAQFPAAFGGGNPNQPNVQQPGNLPPGNIPSMGGAPPTYPNQSGGMPQRPQVQMPGQPSGGMQTQANPLAGNWVVMAGDDSNNFQAQMTLNANGQYQLSINATQNGNVVQIQYGGRWQVQGQFLVFETNGEIERMPLQFDGQRLVMDLPGEGVRIGFARNPQASFVQPLPQQGYPGYGG